MGCYNSGTSLLSDLIATHPDCSGASNEGVALTTELARPEEFGWPRMWTKCAEQMLMTEVDSEANKAADRIKRQWRLSFDKKALCIVEKSISNSLRIEFLSKHFSPAYFVHITRDCVPVAEGIRRKAKPALYSNPEGWEQYPLEMCLDQWIAAEEVIGQALARLQVSSHAVSISYEALCDRPKVVLSGLFSELRLSDECLENNPVMVDKVLNIANMNGRSYAALNPQEIELLKRRCEAR